ncbi:glycosyltransferase [Maritalea mobilis]|uniref:glycosyltransferase n=1 Tax=Maritalea mobilis TaxID=483324 RepID=UPI001C94565A|nr:glycosyltransferase [Maritalea mobilis]MBY6202687.1 glycosyltransferase [Maritalea mobilis]
MLYRLYALYLRYAAHHADRLAGFSLQRDARRPLGHVERVFRANGQFFIVGWSAASELSAVWPDGSVTVSPSIQRADVARKTGLPLESGFEIAVPETARPLTLELKCPSGAVRRFPVRHPSDPPSAAAKRRMRRAFLRDLARALPAGVKWIMRRDHASRTAVKRALGLETVHPSLPLDRRYLGLPPAGLLRDAANYARGDFKPQRLAPPPPTTPITIILPIHNAFDLLPEALSRVARNSDLDWHLILIDDASTDARVRPFLRSWAAEQPDERVTLFELDTNLGFVGAVNKGFAEAEHRAGHVVILNSDAMVPEGWASRLIAPFASDSRIASVTPMSNDAEIFSVPVIVRSQDLPPGMVDRLDAVARTLTHGQRLPSAPTGVGFCMALSSHWFGRHPNFDPAFGRGYGEEVDWCQKVRAMGARHVAIPNLFVEHRGGQSFGSDAKLELVLRANAMIARRYPGYDLEVQSYIASDPLRTPRLALAAALAGFSASGPLSLFVAHSLGGGAEHALQDEIEDLIAEGQSAMVLRVGGAHPFQLEVHGASGVVAGTTDALDVVQSILAPVPALRIVYSCGVGYPDPASLPDVMLSLKRHGHDDRVEARVHDFFMLSPSYNLLNSDGSYRGLPETDSTDPMHVAVSKAGEATSLAEWRRRWGRFLAQCDEVRTFSESSADLVRQVYPELRGDTLRVRPHRLSAELRSVAPPAPGSGHVIGILGNINRAKGGQLLCDLAQRIDMNGASYRMVVIGNVDPEFSLGPLVTLHGSYERNEIAHLAERYHVATWLVPSVWPETFSYVTHEVLQTGLPVIGFDIGAQGEALRQSAHGIPLRFDPDADLAGMVLSALDSLQRPSAA